MKKCYKCKKEIYFNEDIDKCPICGETLEKYLQCKDEELNKISINLDFSLFECDCGNTYVYNEKTCNKCGCENEYGNDIDPKVKLRIEKFQDIQTVIKDSKVYIKNFRKNINNGLINKINFEDFRILIQMKLEEICDLTEKRVFYNVSFDSHVIDKEETTEKICEIEEYMIRLYEIYEDLLIYEAPYIWKNAHRRICNTIKLLLDCNELIIKSIVSETLEEASENMKLAQQNLDIATEEIGIFSNIINIKDLETNFTVFEQGKINIPVVLLMLMGGNNDYSEISVGINNLQLSTYNYFKEFLLKEFEYYTLLPTPMLIKLSSYKYMSMTTFLENKFMEKVRVVLEALEKAKDINYLELKNFICNFKDKYIDTIKIVNDVIQDCVATFSYCNNEKMIINHAMTWYKYLSEGVYKNTSSLLIACAKIIDKKEVDYEDIVNWMGFPDKLGFIKDKQKLKFHKLVDGVDKILRHAEAHADFKIDEVKKEILLRNKIKEGKKINEFSYTYEEFFDLQIALEETIFAIITGMDIFMINNYYEFQDFLIDVDREINIIQEENPLEFTFPFLGVIDITTEQFYESEINILKVKGVSIYRKDRELLDKCISCVYPIVIKKPEIDILIVDIFDEDNIEIGSVEIRTKYMKQYFTTYNDYKKYDTLLISMTTKINYMYSEYIEQVDIYGEKFVSTILQWCMELIEKLNDESIKQNYIYNLGIIKKEVKYSIDTIKEYIPFVEDDRLLKHTADILNDFSTCINKGIDNNEENSLKNNIEANMIYQKVCNGIADIFKYLGEHGNIEVLLEDRRQAQKTLKCKVGRNDLCPCGSGKKYKKCCINVG